jgi:hypothetical protein
MGTSPPSGHAVVVTQNTGRGGAAARPAGCASATADDDIMMIAETRALCIVFISSVSPQADFRNFHIAFYTMYADTIKQLHSGPFHNLTVQTAIERIHFVGPDVAIVIAKRAYRSVL